MRPSAVTRRVKRACVTLLVLLVSSAWSVGQSQPSQGPTLRELKDKLQQLEQSMQELKGEISTLEKAQAQPTPEQATLPQAALVQPASTQAPSTEPGAPPSVAAVQLTPSQPEKPAATGKPQTAMDLYGFAMTDTGYDFGQTDPNWFDVVRPTKLPSFADQFGANGNVYFSVRQTRFGVKTSTPTAWGDLKTQFEFEMFGTGVDAGQTTFRLRHAYGELGPLPVGQTWSPFMDIDVFPNSLEYCERQPAIRDPATGRRGIARNPLFMRYV